MRAYVEGQAALGYAAFDPGPRPDDVILASFPKSGSTWLSYLLHQLRSEGDDGFRDIKDEVIDITPGHWDPSDNPFAIEQRFQPRTFKTHGRFGLCPKGSKVIYVARSPDDVLWSLYHFIHDLFDITERVPIAQFYRHYFVERFGTQHDISNIWEHLLSWHLRRGDPDTLWLHYEDLLEDLPTCIEAVARFVGVGFDHRLLSMVLERATMAHMRSIARQLNPSQHNRTGRVTLSFGPLMQRYSRDLKFGKLRKGVVGGGARSLPASLQNALREEWRKRITPVLGYQDYERMRDECSLLRAGRPRVF